MLIQCKKKKKLDVTRTLHVQAYKIKCTDKRLILLPNVTQVALILNVVDIYTENKQTSPVLVDKRDDI